MRGVVAGHATLQFQFKLVWRLSSTLCGHACPSNSVQEESEKGRVAGLGFICPSIAVLGCIVFGYLRPEGGPCTWNGARSPFPLGAGSDAQCKLFK